MDTIETIDIKSIVHSFSAEDSAVPNSFRLTTSRDTEWLFYTDEKVCSFSSKLG